MACMAPAEQKRGQALAPLVGLPQALLSTGPCALQVLRCSTSAQMFPTGEPSELSMWHSVAETDGIISLAS